MQYWLLRRVLITIPTMLGAITIIFLMLHLIPGDPVTTIMGDYFTQESYEALQRQLGLDRPLLVQYLSYLWKVAHLDLGRSFQNKREVIYNIAEQLPYTIQLALLSLVIAITLALPVGIVSAIYRNRWPDSVSRLLALFAVSSPEFLLGILLLLVFALHLGWLPSFGAGNPGNPLGVLLHLVLPALALGLRETALLARVTRSSMLEVLSQDYVRTARAKGLSERIVVYKHALRNSLIPIITVLGVDLAYLLGGSVIVETVFSRPGVGRVLLDAVLRRDFPQVQGTLLVFLVVAIAMNAIVDLLYVLIDPKIRYA